MERLEHLMNLEKTLAAFQVVSCDMYHERVALDTEGVPIHREVNRQITFERVPLCPLPKRRHRLGCAHSRVNLDFEQFLNDLNAVLEDDKSPELLTFRNNFQALIVEIYALDHKKGQLEHELTLYSMKAQLDKVKPLKKALQEAINDHRNLMAQLGDLKWGIQQLIEKSLKKLQ